jgi:hypothetical protein
MKTFLFNFCLQNIANFIRLFNKVWTYLNFFHIFLQQKAMDTNNKNTGMLIVYDSVLHYNTGWYNILLFNKT